MFIPEPERSGASTPPPMPTPPVQQTLSITGPQHDIPNEVDPLLATILQWPRPHLSFAEVRFRAWLSAQINTRLRGNMKVQYLSAGVMYCTVPTALGKESTVLFSCHVDTVDGSAEGAPVEGENKTQVVKRKSLVYDNNFGMIYVDKSSKVGTCLGADDGIGIWLMLNMLEAGVPGGYMFHTGEECHGIGSHAVLKGNLDILMKYNMAIAFDRPRTTEVITHQGSLRCASDECGKALCAMLNVNGFAYELSTGGSFTDTKVYRGVIPECFNLGVGYERQHSLNEEQDYGHAVALSKALITLDWAALPIKRDPLEKDPVKTWGGHGHYYGRDYGFTNDLDWPDDGVYPRATTRPTLVQPVAKSKGKKNKAFGEPLPFTAVASAYDTLVGTPLDDMTLFAETEPDLAADTMLELMVEIGNLRSELMLYRNMIKPTKH